MSAVVPATRIDFLKWLLSLGTNLPVLWPALVAWAQATKVLINAVRKAAGEQIPAEGDTLAMEQVSPEEEALELEVMQLIAGKHAAFDMNGLRAVFQVFRSLSALAEKQPELVNLLVGFLTRK